MLEREACALGEREEEARMRERAVKIRDADAWTGDVEAGRHRGWADGTAYLRPGVVERARHGSEVALGGRGRGVV